MEEGIFLLRGIIVNPQLESGGEMKGSSLCWDLGTAQSELWGGLPGTFTYVEICSYKSFQVDGQQYNNDGFSKIISGVLAPWQCGDAPLKTLASMSSHLRMISSSRSDDGSNLAAANPPQYLVFTSCNTCRSTWNMRSYEVVFVFFHFFRPGKGWVIFDNALMQ